MFGLAWLAVSLASPPLPSGPLADPQALPILRCNGRGARNAEHRAQRSACHVEHCMLDFGCYTHCLMQTSCESCWLRTNDSQVTK